jgi:Flp pilus assembly pilin Flp
MRHGRLARSIRRFLIREDGPTVAEYAVMLALMVGMVIAIVSALGGSTSSWWQGNADKIIHASQAAAS